MADARLPIAAHDLGDFSARGADAGEMRGGHKIVLGENALDGRVRALARRAAGPVGHRYEYRAKWREAADGVPQVLFHFGRSRREELERDAEPGIRAELKTPTGRQGTQGSHEALPAHFIHI